MKKIFAIAAVAAALVAAPASANEGRVEARAGLGWAGGNEDFVAGLAAGYDIDVGTSAFIGPEVSYDTNFDGFDMLNIGARAGAKVGNGGKLYVGVGYDLADIEEVNASVGYQHSFGEKTYGKIEYRRYFLNGTDLNAAAVGFGVKF